ncbi:cytochrome P450 2J6 [Chanos chanos]|uniref:Cytochrome P450 2J6 n=1 Tax=Chanos chanos TaxID=29144 RepID=A0A6J2VAX4_CHACN|nr:cytochrome P450 2J6-like [Chanos chanos]
MLFKSLLDWLDMKWFLLFLCVFLLIWDYVKTKTTPNFPPGPRAFPFVGNVFYLDPLSPHKYLTKMAEVHGDVYSVRLGQQVFVMVTGFKMAREALMGQADNFVSRSPSAISDRVYAGKGLFLSNGLLWKKQRRFALATLRGLGVGKGSLERAIQEESKIIQDEVSHEKGEPFNPKQMFHNGVANIICAMVFGHRFEYTDQRFQRILHVVSETMYLQSTIWAMLYEIFPSLMKILPGKHNGIFHGFEEVSGYIREELEKHKKDRDPAAPRDYIDTFLDEMETTTEPPEAGFSEANLVLCIVDLLIAGTETTYTTLLWAVLFMIKFPDVQKRVQEEIDAVVGKSRLPSMADRSSLPYTDAVIHESQRMGNILPLGVPYMTVRDTTLGGYFIPKGSNVLFNLNSVLLDENEWKTPNSFDPENFLDADGKFVRKAAFLAFSAGKRVCLGEPLARMELFLFFTSLLQKFTFSVPEGEDPSLEPAGGGIVAPQPYKICAHTR